MRLLIAIILWNYLVLVSSLQACDASDDTDFPKAAALSKRTNRPLLLAFLGTDWSLASVKLDREVFDQAAFADDAKYNFLLCKIHFYQTQERVPDLLLQNQRLAEKYHIEQFPTVVVLNSSGAELGRVGYIAGGVEKFAAAVNAIIFRSRSAPAE
jgi:protein disulfide-isomerase